MFGGVEDYHKIWKKYSFTNSEYMKYYDKYPHIDRVVYLEFAIEHIDEELELIEELYDKLKDTQMYGVFEGSLQHKNITEISEELINKKSHFVRTKDKVKLNLNPDKLTLYGNPWLDTIRNKITNIIDDIEQEYLVSSTSSRSTASRTTGRSPPIGYMKKKKKKNKKKKKKNKIKKKKNNKNTKRK